jgi:molybdenum cofactor cytidylyltransferase
VTMEHLLALMAAGEVTASAYAGRRGVPAYFPAAAFAGLAELTGEVGARELLRGAATVELAGGELDVDTATDLAEAMRLFR